MPKQLASSSTHPVPALFEQLGVEKIKKSDQFTITYKNGLIEANVKRKKGRTETVTKSVRDNGFSQLTTFDPEQMSKSDRNKIIRNMYNQGCTQSHLAVRFGLSQPMIARIVNS